MQIVTLIIAIIGIQKVILMSDPNITSLPKHVSAEERESLGQDGLKFSNYDFNIVFRVIVTDYDGNESEELPIEYARMCAKVQNN